MLYTMRSVPARPSPPSAAVEGPLLKPIQTPKKKTGGAVFHKGKTFATSEAKLE